MEKARLDRIYDNAEIKAMITAFGTGIHEDFDISKLRYHKIIIMTDADVDGAHISTLMLTFIYRFMPELIRQGYVYLAQPPLYKLEKNKKVWYAYSDEQLNQILTEVGRDSSNKIQRYKGLGEMGRRTALGDHHGSGKTCVEACDHGRSPVRGDRSDIYDPDGG